MHVEMNTALIMHEEAQSEELSLTLYLWSELDSVRIMSRFCVCLSLRWFSQFLDQFSMSVLISYYGYSWVNHCLHLMFI